MDPTSDTRWAIERLQQLRGEYAAGETQLAEVERHRAAVHDQLLRIEGAIRVLEEQLADAPEFVAAPPARSAQD